MLAVVLPPTGKQMGHVRFEILTLYSSTQLPLLGESLNIAVWSHHTLLQECWSPNVGSSCHTLAMCINATHISVHLACGTV